MSPGSFEAARRSYGKLIAFLAARTRDVAGAEDALSEAFAAALADWPVRGVPQTPDAARQQRLDEGAAQVLHWLAELAALDALANDARLADYQPYWAARAHLLARSGDIDAALHAYRQAIGLESDPAVRHFLQQGAAAAASEHGPVS